MGDAPAELQVDLTKVTGNKECLVMRNRQHNAESPSDLDPTLTRRSLTFSQAEGLEDLPQPLSLGEVPPQARNLIWDAFWSITAHYVDRTWIRRPWRDVLRDTHVRFSLGPLTSFPTIRRIFSIYISSSYLGRHSIIGCSTSFSI